MFLFMERDARVTDSEDDPEVRLLREHEQILRTREELEEQRRRLGEARVRDRKALLKDRVESERRVDDLAEGIDSLKRKVEASLEDAKGGAEDKKLNDLRDNYWAMVKNVKPVWEEECREFDERKLRKRSGSGREQRDLN